MPSFNTFLLSNERLVPLLSKLYTEEDNATEFPTRSADDSLDVVTWEIFRQIVSPYLDEQESIKRVSTTYDILRNRTEEIKRLRNKCNILAEEFKSDSQLNSLKQNVAKYIAMRVEKDVQDLLALDKNAFGDIRDKLFSDEKTWATLMAFIISLFTGGQLITAGAGLATLSNIFAKTYEIKSNNSKSVKKSEYALLYRIKKSNA